MNKNYEITSETLAIIPISKNVCKIMEQDRTIEIYKSTTEVIDYSCRYFGSSYKGRHEGTKSMTGISYKSPIIIEESREIIFFPTSSPRYDNCYWISLKNIERFYKLGKSSKIIFKNGTVLPLDISYGSLENQILRSTLLESVIRNRKVIK